MEFLFGVRETFEVDCGDGCTIVNVLKPTPLYALYVQRDSIWNQRVRNQRVYAPVPAPREHADGRDGARTGLAQSLARGGDPPCAVLSAGRWKLYGTWPLAHLWPLPVTSALL